MSFEAPDRGPGRLWGKRRQANYVPQFHISTTVSFSLTTTRGYTGHEMLDDLGLVHMNGRVYDPELGRFLSADPFVQDLSDLQSWNRYSYVLNNPLSFTDPSGFFFKSIFKAIGKFFSAIFKAIGSVFKAILNVPLLREVIQIAVCGATLVGCSVVGALFAIAGGGSIGDVLQAIAMPWANFYIWGAVGGVLDGARSALGAGFGLVKSAVHGIVGGALAAAQGGNFVEGFAANALGAAAGLASEEAFGPAGTGGSANYAGRVAVAAIAGGTGSALAGGKFANGALTGAFAQMWNGEGAAEVLKGGVRGAIRGVLSKLVWPAMVGTAAYDAAYRTYITYVLTNPATGQIYAGRTSGWGSPLEILTARLATHPYYMFLGFTNVRIDRMIQGWLGKPAIRGREQQLVDSYGGVGSPRVANLIRPVFAFNPDGLFYWHQSNSQFGPLAPYTGYF